MTLLTDYALGALALFLGFRLLRGEGREPPLSRRLLGAGFVSAAAAALVGGTVHGFASRLDISTRATLWSLIYAAVGLASALVLVGVCLAVLPRAARAFVLAVVGLRLFSYVAFPPARDARYVAYDFAVTLIVLLGCAFDLWLRRGEASGAFILTAILASVLGGFVQTSRLAPDRAFNHNDLFHVIQMGALYLLYRGGRSLRDR